ncbi:hypothetical protein EUA59_00835 [TM7 phylum sp. oral taxon 346]|nr:hypothetical protein EUA59_00835 [TM7 phylum sp. oral taxon 346]
MDVIVVSLPLIGRFAFIPDRDVQLALSNMSAEEKRVVLANMERQTASLLALQCAAIFAPDMSISKSIDSGLYVASQMVKINS